MVTPLRKRKRDGTPYARRATIEAKIAELSLLSRDELLVRCTICHDGNPDFVSNECLLYFVRTGLAVRPNAYIGKLYKLLLERIRGRLRQLENKTARFSGSQLVLTPTIIEDQVTGLFAEMVVKDPNDPLAKLDYYEINFDQALRFLRRDVARKVWSEQNPLTTVDDALTDEMAIEVERAAGSFDAFDPVNFSSLDYRFALQEAINHLPLIQGKITKMLYLGFKIVTIAKVLGKSVRTIQNQRNKAFASLRAALKGESQP